MDRNIEIIKKLAKLEHRDFRDDRLEKMEIHYDDREDLVRKGFLKREGQYPERVYFLSGSAYSLISSNQNEKIAEKGFSWQKWGIVLASILSLAAIILAILSYFK